MQLVRNGNQILSVDDWYQHARPRGALKQWRDGYSAKELAKAWCRVPGIPSAPAEFAGLVANLPGLPGIVIETGFPEHRVVFDGLPGEPRNADLALSCTSLHGRIAISVEGKSRETFGDPIYQVTAEAARKFCEEISTNSMVRLQNLFNGLFRYRRPGMPRVGELRYQLLTAAAGALVAAREIHAVAAALVIHEFRPPNVREDRYLDNARDLSQFLHRLGGGEPQQDWWGPYAVPGNAYLPNNIPLFIGKVVSACDPVEPIIPRRPEA